MKFKRLVSIILVLCMTFLLTSCNAGNSKEVVKGFMSALKDYDVTKMAKYVEDIPSNSSNIYKYDIFTSGYYVDLYKAANEDVLSYKIVSSKNDSVKIKVKMPDLSTLYSNTFMSVVSQAFGNDEILNYVLDEQNDPHLLVIALMIDAIDNGDVDTVEQEFTLKLTKINGELKIKTNEQLEKLMTSNLCLSQKNTLADITND